MLYIVSVSCVVRLVIRRRIGRLYADLAWIGVSWAAAHNRTECIMSLAARTAGTNQTYVTVRSSQLAVIV